MAGFNPFKKFRSIQKYALAALGLMAIFSFVVIPSYLMLQDDNSRSGGKTPLIAKCRRQSGFGNIDEMRLQRFVKDKSDLSYFYQLIYQNMAMAFGNSAETERLLKPLEDHFNSIANRSDERVIVDWLLARYAEEKGVVITDEQISAHLNAISYEWLTTAHFLEICKTMGMPESSVRYLLREALLTQSMMNLFDSSLRPVTMLSNWDYYQRANRSLSLEVAAVPVTSFAAEVKAPSKKELQHFFEENKSRVYNPAVPDSGFATPTRLTFEMIEAVPSDELLASIPREEIEAYYEENKATRFLKREERPLFPGTGSGTSPLPGMDSGVGSSLFPSGPLSGGANSLFPGLEGFTPSDTPDLDLSDMEPAEETPTEETTAEETTPEPAVQPEPVTEEAPQEEAPAPQPEPAAQEETPNEETAETPEQAAFENRSVYRTAAYRAEETEEAAPAVEADKTAEQPAEQPAVEPTEESGTDIVLELGPETSADAENPLEENANEDSPVVEGEGDASILYMPLEEVESTIRAILAEKKLEEAMKEIDKEMREYFTAYTLMGENAPPKLNLDTLAAKYHLSVLREEQLISVFEAQKKDYWRNSRVQQFLFTAFSNDSPNFDVILGREQMMYYLMDPPIRYVGWVTERHIQAVPEFTDPGVEEMVEKRWYEVNARELAKKRAEALAEIANKTPEKSLRESLLAEAVEIVETERFTWYEASYANFSSSGEVPYYSGEIRERGVARGESIFDNQLIQAPGNAFMETAYSLRDGQAGVSFNQPETMIYVVRVLDYFPAEETLWKNFVDTPYFRSDRVGLQMDRVETFQKWLKQIEEYFGFEWVNRPQGASMTQR